MHCGALQEVWKVCALIIDDQRLLCIGSQATADVN